MAEFQATGLMLGVVCGLTALAGAENPPATGAADKAAAKAAAEKAPAQAKAHEGLTPLNPQGTVLLDAPGKRLVLKGEVCLREGLLEMLACLKRSKEHEAILAVDTKAQIVHAGLLALGVEPGKPVQFLPEYRAASGPTIEIFVSWKDEQGKLRREPAQKWIRNSTRRYFIEKLPALPADLKIPADSDLRWDEKHKELLWYGPMTDAQRDEFLKLSKDKNFQDAIRSFHRQGQTKELNAPWVFGGSGFFRDPKTGEKFYQAEGGDLICVANFATAMIDLAINSTAANEDLAYEAFTERIPPVGTPVTIELIPARKQPDKGDKSPGAK